MAGRHVSPRGLCAWAWWLGRDADLSQHVPGGRDPGLLSGQEQSWGERPLAQAASTTNPRAHARTCPGGLCAHVLLLQWALRPGPGTVWRGSRCSVSQEQVDYVGMMLQSKRKHRVQRSSGNTEHICAIWSLLHLIVTVNSSPQ